MVSIYADGKAGRSGCGEHIALEVVRGLASRQPAPATSGPAVRPVFQSCSLHIYGRNEGATEEREGTSVREIYPLAGD